MKTLYELLRFWSSRFSGRFLHLLFRLMRHVSQRMGLSSSSTQRAVPPGRPEFPPYTADVVSASHAPGSHSISERISLGEVSQRPSSSGHRLELDTSDATQRGSTPLSYDTLSPAETTFVASPTSLRRGSLPFPRADNSTANSALQPTTPLHSRRYDQRGPVDVEACKIPAGPVAVHRGRQRTLPSEWQEHTHPEGLTYFVDPRRNIVTEAHVYDERIRQIVSDYADTVLERSASDGWYFSPLTTELLVDFDEDSEEDDASCSYYFINHADKTIFWLEETDTDDFELLPVSGPDHLKTRLHEMYWLHAEYFPVHRELPPNSEQHLVATLTHSCIDTVTSHTSTSSFDRSQLETILSVMKSLKNTTGFDGQRNCIVARLWNEIYHTRFINFFGEKNARLFRNQITVPEKPPSLILKLAFLLLFDAPSTHLTTLQELYVDEVLYSDGWRKFMEALVHDWQDLIFWTTVLLAANMSFLAIFNSKDDVIAESKAVTCSLVSTLCSTVSIVIGLLHVRKHRPRARTFASDGTDYLQAAKHPTLGMRPLAIVYSLPYAFLMWAMVTFIAAILLFTFNSGLNQATTSIIGTIAGCLGATLIWAMSYFWKDELHLVEDFHNLRQRLRTLSPVKLNRLAGKVTPGGHNPEAANTPMVRFWSRGVPARSENEAPREGV